MNASAYFEKEPWPFAVERIRAGAVGRVVEVAVQAVCAPGTLEITVEEWQRRLRALLGAPATVDVLRVEGAFSLLARYSEGAIARLFADEGAGGSVANFEIVGDAGLLLWKPDVHALSVLHTADGCEIAYEHPYAASLAQEAAP